MKSQPDVRAARHQAGELPWGAQQVQPQFSITMGLRSTFQVSLVMKSSLLPFFRFLVRGVWEPRVHKAHTSLSAFCSLGCQVTGLSNTPSTELPALSAFPERLCFSFQFPFAVVFPFLPIRSLVIWASPSFISRLLT